MPASPRSLLPPHIYSIKNNVLVAKFRLRRVQRGIHRDHSVFHGRAIRRTEGQRVAGERVGAGFGFFGGGVVSGDVMNAAKRGHRIGAGGGEDDGARGTGVRGGRAPGELAGQFVIFGERFRFRHQAAVEGGEFAAGEFDAERLRGFSAAPGDVDLRAGERVSADVLWIVFRFGVKIDWVNTVRGINGDFVAGAKIECVDREISEGVERAEIEARFDLFGAGGCGDEQDCGDWGEHKGGAVHGGFLLIEPAAQI